MVAVRSKLFIIEAEAQYVMQFDATSNKYTQIRTPEMDVKMTNATLVGSKIVVIQRGSTPKAVCYDVEKGEWFEKDCKVARNIQEFSCVRVPKF